jgi:hypothetical protein
LKEVGKNKMKNKKLEIILKMPQRSIKNNKKKIVLHTKKNKKQKMLALSKSLLLRKRKIKLMEKMEIKTKGK